MREGKIKTVDLSIEGVSGVIVHILSDISWTNQAGGYACSHPVTSGIFIPIIDITDTLSFLVEDHGGWLSDGLSKEDIVKINEVFKNRLPLKVDEGNADKGMEAWIPIVIGKSLKTFCPFQDFEGYTGVLTYCNSD